MRVQNRMHGLRIAAAVGCAAILIAAGCGRKVSYEEVLKENAESMNRKCPILVEKDVRLDSTSAGPGRRFTYHYTLLDRTLDSMDVKSFENRLRPNLTNNLRTNKNLEILRRNRANVDYRFFDKKGRFLLTISVESGDYKK